MLASSVVLAGWDPRKTVQWPSEFPGSSAGRVHLHRPILGSVCLAASLFLCLFLLFGSRVIGWTQSTPVVAGVLLGFTITAVLKAVSVPLHQVPETFTLLHLLEFGAISLPP